MRPYGQTVGRTGQDKRGLAGVPDGPGRASFPGKGDSAFASSFASLPIMLSSFCWPPRTGARLWDRAGQAAAGLPRVTRHELSTVSWVPIRCRARSGHAFVWSVGSSRVSDMSALGDDVNLTARLASLAAAGEILITE